MTSIGNDAFAGCTALPPVSLPAATSIGDYAFASCTALASVSLPAVTVIGDYAFGGCTSLASVSIPAATTIGDYAFSNCDPLASVSLPAATSIGSSAFADCGSLTSVDFGSIVRTSVPALSSNAFPDLSQSGHTCRIIVPDGNYSEWRSAWSHLLNIGYEFTKYGGMYLKDSDGHYWEITVSTGGAITAIRATPQGSVN